jgi:hypothetical protein
MEGIKHPDHSVQIGLFIQIISIVVYKTKKCEGTLSKSTGYIYKSYCSHRVIYEAFYNIKN